MEDLIVVESHKLARRKLPRNATSLRMTKLTRKSDFKLLQIYYLLTVKRTDQAEVNENLWFSAKRSLTLALGGLGNQEAISSSRKPTLKDT